jgi:hypothetical protein
MSESSIQRLARAAAGVFLTAFGAAQAAPIAFAPALPGQYAEGQGVDGRFLKVFDSWHDSSVPWDEATGRFGSGAPVGSFAWGSGLWGLADWNTANLQPAPGMIERAWTTRVGQIAFADARYNDDHAATWGAVSLAPMFTGPDAPATQDNWTTHFAGYIRIVDAGSYNFSVLHDDGFFFRLGGAGGAMLDLANDYLNPRERVGFEENLELQAGLYSFELGAYDRLEAGVVELSWSVGGGAWTVVPTPHLVADPRQIPEPATAPLLVGGLLALTRLTRRRTPTRRG